MYRLMPRRASTYAVLARLNNFLTTLAFYTVTYIILQLSKD